MRWGDGRGQLQWGACNGVLAQNTVAGLDRPFRSLTTVCCEHARRPILAECDDIEGLRLHPSHFHSRGPNRHAWHCDTRDGGSLFQQPLDICGGYVPLDYISCDQRGVARLRLPRDAMAGLELV